MISIVLIFSLRCGQTLISRLIQLSLQETSQSQFFHGVRRIYAVWSSLEIIAEQEPQIFHQALMERIQVCLNIYFFSSIINSLNSYY